MKYLDANELDGLPGIRLSAGDVFAFRCHPQIACFNRCCRNLNLVLYPYDVLRLKAALGISSDAFIDRYVDVVLRPGSFFPEVLLRMSDNAEKTCPFLTDAGCGVYRDRPDTCRMFPVETGLFYDAARRTETSVYFFRPPDFCRGRLEEKSWTVSAWKKDQQAHRHQQLTVRWARLKRLFRQDPWGQEGPMGPGGKMAFMGTYNLDRVRQFVFESSFLQRYRVRPAIVKKVGKDDAELLMLGFDWVKLFLWGQESGRISRR